MFVDLFALKYLSVQPYTVDSRYIEVQETLKYFEISVP